MNHYCSIILAVFATSMIHGDSVAMAVDPAVIEAQNRRIAVVEMVSPAVVAVFGGAGQGGGSGVLISSDGFALTNFHVVSGAGNFMKCGLNDGILYDAVIVGVDPTGDVALIRLLGRDDFPTVKLGNSDSVSVGDWAFVIGNPFLLATDFQPTVTYGIVSGVHRYQYPAGTFLEYTDCIQVDTSINPGNSGGPLFNEDGLLIGINGRASFAKRGRVNSGAGYAISINQIKHFMDHLRSGRVVDHGTLGATVFTDSDGAVRVASIVEESDAYRRGLRDDDELVSFAGRPIRSVNQFKNILGIYPKGWKLPIVYRRENKKHEIYARISGLHHASEMAPRQRRVPARPFQPKPNQKPKQNPDKQLPDDKPQRPQHPNLHLPAKPPEKYEHMFVEKPGYANYYFNQIEQNRVQQTFDALGDFSSASGRWSLSGRTATADPFEFILTDTAVALEMGDTPFYLTLADDLAEEPPDSGGLLVAMHHLRLFLTSRADAFTEFYYLGSEPLDGHGDTVDILITVVAGVETRWYTSRKNRAFVGFDTRLPDGGDACEVRLQSFESFEGRRLPTRLFVRKGDHEFATFHIEQADLTAALKPKNDDSKKTAAANADQL